MSSGNTNLLDAHAPSTAAVGWPLRHAAFGRRPARVSTRRTTVILLVVPVADPFEDVARHVVQSIAVWRIAAHLHRVVAGIVRLTRRHRVAIGVRPAAQSATRRVFPFGFGGQANYTPGRLRKPIAVPLRVLPCDACDGMVVAPGARATSGVARRDQERVPLLESQFGFCHPECVERHVVHGLLVGRGENRNYPPSRTPRRESRRTQPRRRCTKSPLPGRKDTPVAASHQPESSGKRRRWPQTACSCVAYGAPDLSWR